MILLHFCTPHMEYCTRQLTRVRSPDFALVSLCVIFRILLVPVICKVEFRPLRFTRLKIFHRWCCLIHFLSHQEACNVIINANISDPQISFVKRNAFPFDALTPCEYPIFHKPFMDFAYNDDPCWISFIIWYFSALMPSPNSIDSLCHWGMSRVHQCWARKWVEDLSYRKQIMVSNFMPLFSKLIFSSLEKNTD